MRLVRSILNSIKKKYKDVKKNIFKIIVTICLLHFASCKSVTNELKRVSDFVWQNQQISNDSLLVLSLYSETDNYKFYSSFFISKPYLTPRLLLTCLEKIDYHSIFITSCDKQSSNDYIDLIQNGIIEERENQTFQDNDETRNMIIYPKKDNASLFMIATKKYFLVLEEISMGRMDDKFILDSLAKFFLR
jgi:hypothetical protein